MNTRAMARRAAQLAALVLLGACETITTAPVEVAHTDAPQSDAEIPVRVGTTTPGYVDVNGQVVQAELRIIDGRVIVGGDMDFGPAGAASSTLDRTEPAGEAAQPGWQAPLSSQYRPGPGFRWPDNGKYIMIPYIVTPSPITGSRYTADQWNNVQHAMNRIHEQTRVRFVARTSERDYVRIYPGGDFCQVGRQGGEQPCYPSGKVWQTAMHELGHAIGLQHEHQRADRDTHIVVHTERIAAGMEGEYKILGARDGAPSGAYDFASLMHYGPSQWAARKDQQVMEPNRRTYPNARLWAGNCNDQAVLIKPWGCRAGFSPGDVAGIEAMYAIPYNAGFRDQNVATIMEAGREYTVTVVMENRGMNTWSPAEGYKLGSQNPQDNLTWGTGRAALPGAITRGQTAPITFRVRAPTAPGRYNFQWRMLRENVTWFGEFTPNLSISVMSAPFSLVSLMHGKCLDAPSAANGTRVHLWDCIPGNVNQRWSSNPATGEVRVHGGKCLDGWTGRLGDPVVVHDCHGGTNQQWDLTAEGQIRMRNFRDPSGRPLCVDIEFYLRTNGAKALLYTCHGGENQLWRKDAEGVGGSAVSIATALDRRMCMDAPSAARGTELQLWDCIGPSHANQRFRRTPGRTLVVQGKCVDGDNGNAYAPVKLWDCHGGPNQQWDLTPNGELRGVNNLCIDVRGAVSARGTRMMLYPCHGGANQRWIYRDPGR
ncbi:MAG TPA: ricin-type beta-trefoil lectin domain protein [Longimicrobiaceae bacterium]|nr:ricin-type beta-trefoil lectin domain protein [Longimicrobiaceae bacterium]